MYSTFWLSILTKIIIVIGIVFQIQIYQKNRTKLLKIENCLYLLFSALLTDYCLLSYKLSSYLGIWNIYIDNRQGYNHGHEDIFIVES